MAINPELLEKFAVLLCEYCIQAKKDEHILIRSSTKNRTSFRICS